jgi:phospholipase/carboxylesterase
VANGFSNLELLDGDEDLVSLRDMAGYKDVRSQIQRNIRETRAELVRRFEAAPPLIVPPPDHDPALPVPLVIALHGFGGEAKGFPMWWQGATARVGAILVAPQAVQPHPNGGWAWEGAWQTDEIVELTLSHVQEQFAVDAEKIVLTGFSQGGSMAMAVGVLHPERFAGVVPMAGAFNEARDAPPPPPSSGAPRYYFMVGANDQNRNQALVAARAFEDAGYDVELQVYPKVGHTFPLAHDKVLARVLEHVLQD